MRARLACGAAIAMAVTAYLNGLHNPFVYDDYRTILGNTSIQLDGTFRALVWHDVTRPLVNLSYALNHAAWGNNPLGFHLTKSRAPCSECRASFSTGP